MNIDVFLKTSNMPFPRQPATLKGIHKEKSLLPTAMPQTKQSSNIVRGET